MPAIKSALGNVSEGPQRWVRARENAAAFPLSKGGKLYRKREKVAAEIVQSLFAHQRQAFTLVRNNTSQYTQERRFHLCSLECLAFQMQLDAGDAVSVQSYVDLVQQAIDAGPGELASHTWRPRIDSVYEREVTITRLDRTKLERTVTCRVCGDAMTGDKQAVAAIAKVTETTKQYVLIEGQLMLVGDIKVVNLTARDFELLDCYSTADLRAAYVYEFGHRLDA